MADVNETNSADAQNENSQSQEQQQDTTNNTSTGKKGGKAKNQKTADTAAVENTTSTENDVVTPTEKENEKNEKETKNEEHAAQQVTPSLSPKEAFEAAIAKMPFIIYQKGLMICRWKPHVKITTSDLFFTINGTNYSYVGTEVRHI